MARLYFYVSGQDAHWVVMTNPDEPGTFFPTRATAIDYAATAARAVAAKSIPSGVRVQGTDGRWQDERTYGEVDPA